MKLIELFILVFILCLFFIPLGLCSIALYCILMGNWKLAGITMVLAMFFFGIVCILLLLGLILLPFESIPFEHWILQINSYKGGI